jgi:hypothetical protein
MKKICSVLLASALAFTLSSVQATTVIPPSFDQLVQQAELIFQGTVTDVHAQWVGEGGQRHIESYITFTVEDAVKGKPGQTYTLRMFGGTVGDQGMAISDAPKFAVGDRDILFVENNGTQVIPLVGIMYGRFHVKKDEAGGEVVTQNEGQPVKSVARLGREMDSVVDQTTEPTMTAAEFKAAVRSKLQEAR